MIDKILAEAGFAAGPDALTSLTSALAQRTAEVAVRSAGARRRTFRRCTACVGTDHGPARREGPSRNHTVELSRMMPKSKQVCRNYARQAFFA